MSVSDPSPTRTSIVEANKHLELLHERVNDLENDIQVRTEHDQALKSSFEKEKQNLLMNLKRLKAESAAKDVELKELRKLLDISNKKVDDYRRQLEQKDAVVDNLKDKCKHMASILSYQPMLQNLITTMSKVNLLEQPARSKNLKHKSKRSEVPTEKLKNGVVYDTKHDLEGPNMPQLNEICNNVDSEKLLTEVNSRDYDADSDSPLKRNPLNQNELYL